MESKPISLVYNCDCVEYMRTLQNDYFDLAIADPPYGIDIASHPFRSKHKAKKWDNAIPKPEFFTELFRVSKNQIIWGGNYFYLPPTKCFIIWDKKQPFNFTSSMCEFAWTSFNSPAKIFRQHISSNGEIKIHPTQKSVSLYGWILQHYASVGYKIFDPMLGSGSSRIAAYIMGFDFWACELDADYYNAQEERFLKECKCEFKQGDKTIKQLQLF